MFASKKKQGGGVIPIIIVSISIFAMISWYGQKSQGQMSIISSNIALTNETRVKMNNAATVILGYANNSDSDDYYEPPTYTLINGNPSVDVFARYETDSWGEYFVYCPYDLGNDGHLVEGEKDPSQNIFKGNGKTSSANNTSNIFALISKGKNKKLDSSCNHIASDGSVGPITSNDDIVMVYNHGMVFSQVSSNGAVSGSNPLGAHVFETRQEFESALNGRAHGSVHQVDIQRNISGVPTRENKNSLVYVKSGVGALSASLYFKNDTHYSKLAFQKNEPHFLELVAPHPYPAKLTVVTKDIGGHVLATMYPPGLYVNSISSNTITWRQALVEDGLYFRRTTTAIDSTLENSRAYLSKTKGFRTGNLDYGDTRAISFDPRDNKGLHWQSSTTGTTNGINHISGPGNLNIINDVGMMIFQRKFNKNTTGSNSYDTTVTNNAACENIYTGLLVRDAAFKIAVCN